MILKHFALKANFAVLLCTASTLAPTTPLTAQNIRDTAMKADELARANNWKDAYPLYKQTTEIFKEDKLIRILGDAIAYFWYRRAQSASIVAKDLKFKQDEASKTQRIKLLQEAITYYGKCNTYGTIQNNPRKNYAIFNIGKLQKELGNHEDAIKSFKKFRSNYNKQIPNEYDLIDGKQRAVLIHLQTVSVLKQKNPDLDQGEKGILWLLQSSNRTNYRIPSPVVTSVFHAYCSAINLVANEAQKNKELDTVNSLEKRITSFISKHRGLLKVEPYMMHQFTDSTLNLSLQMRKLNMHKASFAIQSLLPNSIAMQQDLEQKLRNLDKAKFTLDVYNKVEAQELKRGISNVEKKSKEGKTHEIIQHLSLASYYDNEENHRSAFAIYETLELYHQNNPKREESLFHLVRTANNIGAVEKTYLYGRRFLDLYPKSKHVSAIEEFMLLSLFNNKEYVKCLEVGRQIIQTIEPNTKQHDIALYCIASSHFFLGQHDKATPLLEQHVKLYGKNSKQVSPYLKATQYLDGANQAYLENWQPAVVKLEKYLQDFPEADNSYLGLAKYELARSLSKLGEDTKAITLLDDVCSNHKSSSIIDRAHITRGSCHKNIESFEKAYSDYAKGLELSKAANNPQIESEALHYLVLLLGDDQQKEGEQKRKNFKLAVRHYETFWQKFSKSPYSIYVSVSGLPALIANGKSDEGMGNLKQVITELSKKEHAANLDKAINTYTEKYLEIDGNTAESLRKHYLADFAFPQEQVYARSLVKLSLIDVYGRLEQQAKSEEDAIAAKKWSDSAQGQIDEIAKMDKSQLNNYTLIVIGNNILEKANNIVALERANDFFEQAMQNVNTAKDNQFENEALFGLVKTVIATKDKAKIPNAINKLKALSKKADLSVTIKKQILVHLTKLNATLGNHKDTILHGSKYLETFKGPKFRSQVRLDVANAYFELGQLKESLLHYQSIVISSAGKAKFSCPAILRILEISSKQERVYSGYKSASSFVKMCEKSFNKAVANGTMNTNEVKLWEKVQHAVDGLI